MYLDGRDESFTEVAAQNKLSARYEKFIDFCMNLDALHENKSLTNSDLDDIDIILDNAIRTINEMVEKRIKPNQKKSAS